MAPCYEKLTAEEKARNKFGPMLIFNHCDKSSGMFIYDNTRGLVPKLQVNSESNSLGRKLVSLSVCAGRAYDNSARQVKLGTLDLVRSGGLQTHLD